jgi:DNA polymerase I-like protein with 3'-5' exonuclease and polymerase domains
MIEVQAWLMGGEMDAWMVMQVQDQRGFEVK